jgi:hypothetical protein
LPAHIRARHPSSGAKAVVSPNESDRRLPVAFVCAQAIPDEPALPCRRFGGIDLLTKRSESNGIQPTLDASKQLALLEANVAVEQLAERTHGIELCDPLLDVPNSGPNLEVFAHEPICHRLIGMGIVREPARKENVFLDLKVKSSVAVPKVQEFRGGGGRIVGPPEALGRSQGLVVVA